MNEVVTRMSNGKPVSLGLYDCTHVASKRQFKAGEELKKEIIFNKICMKIAEEQGIQPHVLKGMLWWKAYIKETIKLSFKSKDKELMEEIGERFCYHSDIDGVTLKLNDLQEYQEFKESKLK